MNDSDLRAQLSLTLGGAYVLERELETAGRSRLFLAREVYHDRDVVVKVLPPEVSEGVVMERFEREIHFIGALQEPHTVPVLSTGATVSGHLFYTMPYIAEPSLGRRLEAGPISFDDSIIALRDVARAMAHAHRQNIVHGDIQPEKVFLLKGVAVVTDFGVASALEASRRVEERRSLRLVRTSVATPAYTAPEHAAASPESDHRADIYAWGVMAYELLYDQHPFPNVATEADLLEAHTSAPPPVPPHKQFGIPEQLAVLVMRCIAKNPDERPNDAAELLSVLERIPSGAAALAIESWSTYRLIGFTMVAFALFLALAAMIWRVQAVSVDEPTLVAVLPMENSGSTADTVFSEAIEHGIIAKLARLPSIRLVDVGSVHAVADGRDAWETGKALGAQYVLRTGPISAPAKRRSSPNGARTTRSRCARIRAGRKSTGGARPFCPTSRTRRSTNSSAHIAPIPVTETRTLPPPQCWPGKDGRTAHQPSSTRQHVPHDGPWPSRQTTPVR